MVAQNKMLLSKLYGMPETTFGTEPDASGATYKHLMAMRDMAFQPGADLIPREGLTKDMTRQPHVIGGKKGSLSFKMYLKGSGTPAASAVAAIASDIDPILKHLTGTVVRGTGGLIQAGSTTGVINVVTGTNFSVGMMVNCQLASGAFATRFIASIATNALTLDRVLPSAPETGGAGVITASSRYTRANSGQASLAFVGFHDGIEYTLLGCKGSGKITGIGARGSAILECTFEVADWSATTKASLPAADPTGITAVKAPAIKGAPFAVAGTEEPIYALEFDIGSKYEFQESTAGAGLAGGDGTIAGMEMTDAMPGGTFKSYYKSQHLTDFMAGTENVLAFSCGSTSNGFGFYIPKAQYAQPQMEAQAGVVGESVGFMVNDNGSAAEYYICIF